MPKDIQNSGGFTSTGGMYRPPEFFDSGYYKKGDIDKWKGQSHMVAQGGYARLKKMQEGKGVLLVRFEMPMDIWCAGCNAIVAMGVRFNDAEKTRVGRYFSTPIYSFRMRHHCGSHFVIQSDPKNTTFNVIEGGREKITPHSKAKLCGEEAPTPTATDANLAAVEKQTRDATNGTSGEVLVRILELKNEFAEREGKSTAAYLLRRHREQKGCYLKNSKEEAAQQQTFGMKLQPASSAEAERAANVNFKTSSKNSIASRVQTLKRKREEKAVEEKETARMEKNARKVAAKSAEYQVKFVCSGGDSDNLEEPPPAPPLLYRVLGSSTPEQLSRLLSTILGEAEVRMFRLSLVGAVFRKDRSLHSFAQKHGATTEDVIDLSYSYEDKGAEELQISPKEAIVHTEPRIEEGEKGGGEEEEGGEGDPAPRKKRKKEKKNKPVAGGLLSLLQY